MIGQTVPARLANPKVNGVMEGVGARITEWVSPHSGEFAAGAVLPWLAIILIPGSPRALAIFLIVLIALALTGRVSAEIADVHSLRPLLRMAAAGIVSMAITYSVGHLIHP